MKHGTTRRTKMYGSIAAVAIVMLLGAALVVPSSNAYAASQTVTTKHPLLKQDKIELRTAQKELNTDTSELKKALADKQYAKAALLLQEMRKDVATIKQDTKDVKVDITDIKQFNKEQRDKKEDKKPDKCKPNKDGKYNKDCKEDKYGRSTDG